MQFVLWTGLESLAVRFLLLPPLVFAGFESRTDLDHLGWLEFFLLAVVEAPIVETIALQAIPIILMRWIRLPFSWQVGVSRFLFFNAHLALGPVSAFTAGLIAGFYLAFDFSYWASNSYWTAFWTTVLQHSLGNCLIFLVVAVFGGFDDTQAWLPEVLFIPTIVFLIIIFWVFFAKNALRFEEMIGRRVLTVTHQIRRGMPSIRAESILNAAGFECRKVESSDHDVHTSQLFGTISSVPYFGDSTNWLVVVDVEQRFVASVSSRMEKNTDSPTVASSDSHGQIWV